MRITTVLLLAALLLGCATAAADAAKPRSACQKLAKGRKDVAPSRTLVVVVRGDEETGRIAGCVLPRGKVRTLASWDDPLIRDWSNVVRIAGTFVIVEDAHSDQYGGASRALTRVDVRSGRRLGLSSWGCMLDFSQSTCPDGTSTGRIGMAASGAGAYELTDLATHLTTLQAFSPSGTFTKLADGAVDALRVTSAGIRWTQGGVEHTAPLGS